MVADHVKVLGCDSHAFVNMREVVHATLREVVLSILFPKRHDHKHAQMLHVFVSTCTSLCMPDGYFNVFSDADRTK